MFNGKQKLNAMLVVIGTDGPVNGKRLRSGRDHGFPRHRKNPETQRVGGLNENATG